MRQTSALRSGEAAHHAGRYRIDKQLAVGGMGTIYVAYDSFARREVAYKRLTVAREAARPRLMALFEREYHVLRQLKHPNIVEVYDYGLDAEGPYYTMELLAGQDLAGAAPLPLTAACRVLRDVASALALLHARRLVHRDVTPANVRLTQDGRAKLIDFGALAEFGVAKEVVGTPAFIAPECLEKGALDGRVDLFALGGVAYWALTRRQAYPGAPAPSTYDAALPREVDELVLSLLDRDPVARPPSAAHVIERLSAIADLPPEHEEAEVAYSYLMHPPLVGRDVLLDQLRLFIAEAASGKGRSVIVEGPRGLGRSAVLDQVAIQAELAGANVLRFQPNGKRNGALALAIVQWMRGLFPSLWSEALVQHPLLGRELRTVVGAQQSLGELTQQRAELVAAAQTCVAQMSQHALLVVLVDDVHRADAESLSLLASLARGTGDARVLLISAQEERTQGSDVSALGDLRAAATLLTLKPLTESDVERMVDTVFGNVPNAHRVARFLHARSGGNPGQCMNLCRLLLEREEIRYALGTFALPFDPRGELPGERALELTRLAGLSERALRAVELLSLAQTALSAGQVALALTLEELEVSPALEELVGRGLARRDADDVSIASESLRDAVRESLTAEGCAALHVGLSRAVLSRNGDAIETRFAACHHLLCAGREDEAIALVWEPLRCESLPLGSTAACVPMLERLLDVMRRRGHPDEHCWPLLSPLVNAGFWGELGTVARHREAALTALSNMTGIALARRLTPRLGRKLALIVGVLSGIIRHARTPKRYRPPSYGEAMQRLFSAVTMSTATASSAFEPETALQVTACLDPIEAMSERSPGRVAREFALATADVGAGRWASASRRYEWILEQLTKHKIFDETTTATMHDGCMHGRAQAQVTLGSPHALKAADDLEKCDPFFRPHVENIRMSFHGHRGEKELAEYHRKKSELLALQGGVSWSAFTVLSIRTAYVAMLSQDTLGVMRAGVELERLAAIAPNAMLYRDLCHAYVAMARGQNEAALAIYERIAARPHARLMPTFEVDAAMHAEALLRLGRIEEAKRLCEDAIEARKEHGASTYGLRSPTQQLAMCEAKLGNFGRAKELLDSLFPAVLASEGPLAIGSLWRDRARIALLERDVAAFDQHFAAMLTEFRKTKNQLLIQQCRRLLAEAEALGVAAAPSWEKHELMPPANTQDLVSQLPDATELIDTCA